MKCTQTSKFSLAVIILAREGEGTVIMEAINRVLFLAETRVSGRATCTEPSIHTVKTWASEVSEGLFIIFEGDTKQATQAI